MNPLQILVIGGVAAGASFAARARRLNESAQITVIERGPDVSFANCGLPYHIGGEIPVRDVLAMQTPASLKALLNVDVRTRCEAVRIDRENKRVLVRDQQTEHSEWLSYDKLMLAPGAAPRVPATSAFPILREEPQEINIPTNVKRSNNLIFIRFS